ncbi:MAG: hypothetical protein OXN21_14125 [Chloroflexota bacterium]|nr:hypothetical protein [Chloroflexota bacterium]
MPPGVRRGGKCEPGFRLLTDRNAGKQYMLGQGHYTPWATLSLESAQWR